MPYSLRSKNLPAYVKKLPVDMRKKWVAIFNRVYSKEGEQTAFIVANSWLKRTLRKRAIAARTKKIRDIVYFKLDNKKEFIQRTENGEDFISFKLVNVGYDTQGKNWTAPLLQKWAEQINSGQTVLGDIDHAEFEKLVQAMYSEEEVKERIQSKPSVAKAVKAVFENGALWIKAILDKRYRKMLEKSKGVSLEAIVDTDDIGTVLDGDLLGFTFGINEDPVIDGTEVHYHGAS